MGLSICRSIIEAHGGQLWATQNNPQGTIFFMTLSLEETPIENREPSSD
jgi:K+-sensing histidine kinase KdpD